MYLQTKHCINDSNYVQDEQTNHSFLPIDQHLFSISMYCKVLCYHLNVDLKMILLPDCNVMGRERNVHGVDHYTV